MVSFRPLHPSLLLAAGLGGIALLLPGHAAANPYAPVYQMVPVYQPVRVSPGPAVPVRNWPAAPYQDYAAPVPYAQVQPGPMSWQEAQAQQQRCSIGRLVGGVLGGGIGYAASRQDGRTWAVPLGALLGSQVGCNTGQGRAPLPW